MVKKPRLRGNIVCPTPDILRKLTGVFFEFLLPGQGDPEFLHPNPSVVNKKKYRTTALIAHVYEEYKGDAFKQYLSNGKFVHLPRQTELEVSPDDVHFEHVISEIRKCTSLIDWYHSGKKEVWLRDKRYGYAATKWLHADDISRRRVLRGPHNGEDPVVASYLMALDGSDRNHEIAQRIKMLSYRCDMVFLEDERHRQTTRQNFGMTKSDAAYLVRLYDLSSRIDASQLKLNEQPLHILSTGPWK